MSRFLNSRMAYAGVNLVRNAIDEVLASTTKRNTGYLVVRFNGEVIAEAECGEQSAHEWAYQFDRIAHSKAEIAEREQSTTREVGTNSPWLFEVGDTPFAGGVYLDGIAVAFSGVEDYYDEMFAWWVAYAIQALCRAELAKFLEENPEANFFE